MLRREEEFTRALESLKGEVEGLLPLVKVGTPVRVIKGARTGIHGPMGVAFDLKNDEIWVPNYGDHTALVFARTASGDVVPKRIVRNAPEGSPTVGFGNPGAVAYDSKRDEILVPN